MPDIVPPDPPSSSPDPAAGCCSKCWVKWKAEWGCTGAAVITEITRQQTPPVEPVTNWYTAERPCKAYRWEAETLTFGQVCADLSPAAPSFTPSDASRIPCCAYDVYAYCCSTGGSNAQVGAVSAGQWASFTNTYPSYSGGPVVSDVGCVTVDLAHPYTIDWSTSPTPPRSLYRPGTTGDGGECGLSSLVLSGFNNAVGWVTVGSQWKQWFTGYWAPLGHTYLTANYNGEVVGRTDTLVVLPGGTAIRDFAVEYQEQTDYYGGACTQGVDGPNGCQLNIDAVVNVTANWTIDKGAKTWRVYINAPDGSGLMFDTGNVSYDGHCPSSGADQITMSAPNTITSPWAMLNTTSAAVTVTFCVEGA